MAENSRSFVFCKAPRIPLWQKKKDRLFSAIRVCRKKQNVPESPVLGA
jgi:hypothetical protein